VFIGENIRESGYAGMDCDDLMRRIHGNRQLILKPIAEIHDDLYLLIRVREHHHQREQNLNRAPALWILDSPVGT
jgi:hypothetical protein